MVNVNCKAHCQLQCVENLSKYYLIDSFALTRDYMGKEKKMDAEDSGERRQEHKN